MFQSEPAQGLQLAQHLMCIISQLLAAMHQGLMQSLPKPVLRCMFSSKKAFSDICFSFNNVRRQLQQRLC